MTGEGKVSAKAAGAPAEGGLLAARLRDRLEQLDALELDEAARARRLALEVSLTALEGLEARAVADERLLLALRIRAAEVGRQIAELRIEGLGYYALPAAEPERQHNELPIAALDAQDAVDELIRYLDDGFAVDRDRLARALGLASDELARGLVAQAEERAKDQQAVRTQERTKEQTGEQ